MRVRCGETIEMQLAPEMLAAIELFPRADDDGQLGPYLPGGMVSFQSRGRCETAASRPTHPANVVDGCDRALVNDML